MGGPPHARPMMANNSNRYRPARRADHRRLSTFWFAILTLGLLAGCGEASDPNPEFMADWPDDRPLPSAEIDAVESDSGIVLMVELTNFDLSQPAIEDADGHFHIRIDGAGAQMVHHTMVEIDALSSGTHEIELEFVANDHRTYGVGGVAIGSTATVEIDADGSVVDVRPAP